MPRGLRALPYTAQVLKAKTFYSFGAVIRTFGRQYAPESRAEVRLRARGFSPYIYYTGKARVRLCPSRTQIVWVCAEISACPLTTLNF